MLILKNPCNLSPEKTKELHSILVEQIKSGVVILPSYLEVIHISEAESKSNCAAVGFICNDEANYEEDDVS